MPQANSELQRQWPGGDREAIHYLQNRGYRLTGRWEWLLPHDETVPSDRDWSAIAYLIEEWDFGPLLLPGRKSAGGARSRAGGKVGPD